MSVKEITLKEAQELLRKSIDDVTATILKKRGDRALLHRVERWADKVAVSEFVVCRLNDNDFAKSPGETVTGWSESQYIYDLSEALIIFNG